MGAASILWRDFFVGYGSAKSASRVPSVRNFRIYRRHATGSPADGGADGRRCPAGTGCVPPGAGVVTARESGGGGGGVVCAFCAVGGDVAA